MKGLDDLYELFSAEDALTLTEELSSFAGGAELTEELSSEILSSVLSKAGYKMKKTKIRTKRTGKRFIAILAAAVVVLVSAVAAGAYYVNYELIWNGLRWRLGSSGEVDTEKLKTLEEITSRKGEMTGNSFEELDVTFEGVVSDDVETYVIFNVRRKDGQAMTAPEGYEWVAGFVNERYLSSEDVPVNMEPGFERYSPNEDGSLSVAVQDDDNALHELDRYFMVKPSEVGFTGLYCVPQLSSRLPERAEDKPYFDVRNMGVRAAAAYENGEDSFESLREEYFAALEEMSVQSYSGTATCEFDTRSLTYRAPEFRAQYQGQGINVTVSPIAIRIVSDEGRWDHERITEGLTLEIHFTDGTVVQGSLGNNAYGGNSEKAIWSASYVTDGLIDVTEISYLLLDGERIDIMG